MEKILDLICKRCGAFLNRPVQTDGVLIKDGKILLLYKNPKFLSSIYVEHFYGKYLEKDFKEALTKGHYVLPGHAVKKIETIEESVIRTFYDETGIKTKIIGVIGIFSDTKRDPKSSGVSVSFRLEYVSGEIKETVYVRPEWHDINKLPDTILFDHKKIIEQAKLNKDETCILNSLDQTPNNVFERRIRRVSEEQLCPRCGQFGNRPAQTDGILFKNNKVLLIRRRRHISKSDSINAKVLEDIYSQAYMPGWFALPGGYIKRGSSSEQTIIKEFKQETGLDVKVSRLIGIFSDLDRDPKSSGISFLYELKEIGGKLKITDETSEVRYYDIDNLPTTIAYDHADMIAAYLKYKSKRIHKKAALLAVKRHK